MNDTRPIPSRASHARHAGSAAGFTLLELIMALAITTVVTAAAIAGGRAIVRAALLEGARVRLVTMLTKARRDAYVAQQTVEVAVRVGDDRVQVVRESAPAKRVGRLGEAVTITRAPASGRIRFFPSGLADNATVAIAAGGHGEATVVVNQRGAVR